MAVDLFMMLSGFLMAHNYLHRRSREPWGKLGTIAKFWVRRFLRIAPLYYALLAAALILGPTLGKFRTAIADVWPVTATPLERYNDQTVSNILQHVTFFFGAIPRYAFRTPLPDWSIGLEMQFYLAFPLLMPLIASRKSIAIGLCIFLACFSSRWLAHNFIIQFLMPSFLPMKIGTFIIGMWAAIGQSRPSMLPMLISSIAVALISSSIERYSHGQTLFLLTQIVGFFYLMNNRTLPFLSSESKITMHARTLLPGKISKFLGETSYGVYLLHLLILIPIAGALSKYSSFLLLPEELRFIACFSLAVTPIYLGAWVLYETVEQPRIQLGKALITLFRPCSEGTAK